MTKLRLLLGGAVAVAVAFAGVKANAQSGEVVWYGYAGKHIEPTVKAFNQHYPNIKVKALSVEGGELLSRLRAEKDRPLADVCWCAGNIILNHSYLFRPYRTKHHDDFSEWALMKVGNDIFSYGYSISIQIFLFNNKMMPLEKAPKSWADLTKAEYKGKFMVGNPAMTTAGYYSFFQFLQMYGWDAMEKYVENGVFSPSVNAVPIAVARGEVAMGITEETKAWKMAEQGYPVKVYYPTEGIVPTLGGIALVKNSPNSENGLLLADFINSREAHNINVAIRNRRMARSDANPPKGLVPLPDLKVNEKIDLAEAWRMRPEWVKKFDEIFLRKRK